MTTNKTTTATIPPQKLDNINKKALPPISTIISNLQSPNNSLKTESVNDLLTLLKTEHQVLVYNSLQKHIDDLELTYKSLSNSHEKRVLADILSYIILNDSRMVKYRSKGNVIPLDMFGYQYVKYLLTNILSEYKLDPSNISNGEISAILNSSIEYLFKNNGEIDGIDFCIELDLKSRITENTNKRNSKKVLAYLLCLDNYILLGDVLANIYEKLGMIHEQVLLILNDTVNERREAHLKSLWNSLENKQKVKVAFLLNHCNTFYEFIESPYSDILRNCFYKSVMENAIVDFEIDFSKNGKDSLNNSELSLIANGFNNFGMQQTQITEDLKNDQKSIINFSTQGMIHFCNMTMNERLSSYFFSTDTFLKIGSLSALGYSNTVYDEFHSVLGLLMESITSLDEKQKVQAVFVLEHMYCDTRSPVARSALVDMLNTDSFMVQGVVCFALGSVFCGSFDSELTDLLLSTLLMKSQYRKEVPFKFIILGLALLILQDSITESEQKVLENIHNSIKSTVEDPQDIIILLTVISNLNKRDKVSVETIFKNSFFMPDDPNEELDESSGRNEELERNTSIFMLGLLGVDKLSIDLFIRLVSTISLIEDETMLATSSLTLCLLMPSNPTPFLVDQLIRICNKSSGKSHSIGLLSLAIIAGGSKNQKVIEYIKQQREFQSDDSRQMSFLLLLEGLVNMGRGTHCFSRDLFNNRVRNRRGFVGLLSFLFLLLDETSSKDLLCVEYPSLFFLLLKSVSSKVCSGIQFSDISDISKYVFSKDQVEIGNLIDGNGDGNRNLIQGGSVFDLPVVKQKCEGCLFNGELVEGIVVVDGDTDTEKDRIGE